MYTCCMHAVKIPKVNANLLDASKCMVITWTCANMLLLVHMQQTYIATIFHHNFISIDKSLIFKPSYPILAVIILDNPKKSLTNYLKHTTIQVHGNQCGNDVFFNFVPSSRRSGKCL